MMKPQNPINVAKTTLSTQKKDLLVETKSVVLQQNDSRLSFK